MAYCAGVAEGHTESVHSAGFNTGTDAERVKANVPYTNHQSNSLVVSTKNLG